MAPAREHRMGLILLKILPSLGYLALAVIGRGGWHAFVEVPALVGLAAAFFVVVVAALFVGGNLSSGVREDRGNRWVLAAFGIVGLLMGIVPAYTDRLDFWTIGGDGVRWFGVVLFVLGSALRLWPVAVLGDRFSGLVAIQPGHTLYTGGIYRIIRHPSYLGALILSLGWCLAFRSLPGVLLAALLVPTLIGRMNAEERLLQSEFGAAYDAFRARTRARLIPGVY